MANKLLGALRLHERPDAPNDMLFQLVVVLCLVKLGTAGTGVDGLDDRHHAELGAEQAAEPFSGLYRRGLNDTSAAARTWFDRHAPAPGDEHGHVRCPGNIQARGAGEPAADGRMVLSAQHEEVSLELVHYII